MRKKGLNPQHLGLVIDNRLIAPPSQFALAYVGTRRKKTLDTILSGISKDVKSHDLDVEDTPLLAYYVESDSLNTNTLAEMVQKTNGSQKMVIKSSVLPVNQKGQLMTVSTRPQVSARIDSRRLSCEQKPYLVQIYDPFDLLRLKFEGGTRFTEVTLERGEHWNEGFLHEKQYLDTLSRKARKQFEQPFTLIDYARASALIALDELVRSGHEKLVRFAGDIKLGEVQLPFNFSVKNNRYDRTKYALEAFLLKYAPRKIIREVTGHHTGNLGLNEIDAMLLGKKIVPPRITDHFAESSITKGALLKNKSFSGYNWAIIQALEEHYFNEGRRFKGYSLEFVDNPGYRTISIVFDMPPHSKREEQKKISTRIVFDDTFGRPYLLYKVFDPGEYARRWSLLDRAPTTMINMPIDRQKSKWVKKWQETDWRTGKRARCTLREPTDDILKKASGFIERTNGRNFTPYEMRGWYIDAMKKR